MANEISNDVTIMCVDNMIYQAICELRKLSFSKDRKSLRKKEKSLLSRQRRRIHSFYQKAISIAVVISAIDPSDNSLVVLLPALRIIVLSCLLNQVLNKNINNSSNVKKSGVFPLLSNGQCTKIQLSQKHFWRNFKITDHKYRFRILKIPVFLADIGYLIKLLSNH